MGFRVLTIAAALLGSSICSAQSRAVVVVPRSLESAAEQLLQRQIEGSVQRDKVKLVSWSSIQSKLALAGSTSEQAEISSPTLDKARGLYLKQQFDEMRRALVALETGHLRQLARSPQRAASVSLLLGVALALSGKTRAAAARFRLARRLAGDCSLDPALYPPAVIALSKQAWQEQASARRHDLQLVVVPPAQVYVDNRPSGSSATPISVETGLHYVVLTRLGYRTETMLLDVQEPLRKAVQLQRLSALERRAQLARRLRDGQLAADEREARVIAELTGASKALLWAASGQRVSATLLSAKGARAIVVPATSVGSLWQRLTRPADFERNKQRRRPLWTRWWVWAGVAAIVGGVVGTTAVVLSTETDVLVRVR